LLRGFFISERKPTVSALSLPGFPARLIPKPDALPKLKIPPFSPKKIKNKELGYFGEWRIRTFEG
jgi:hypothetical protein